MRAPDELATLKSAAAGLLYPSESDAPFDVFTWPATTATTAHDAVTAHAAGGGAVEEVALAEFFTELEASDDGPRYSKLRARLTSTFSDVKVLRVGQRKVDVFLIGRAKSGAWAGVHTTSVET